MAASPTPNTKAERSPEHGKSVDRGSKAVVLGSASNELIFAVVGMLVLAQLCVAESLKARLKETTFNDEKVVVKILKARDVIKSWAEAHGMEIPSEKADGQRLIKDVERYQDLGDEMRKQITSSGEQDHAAVASGLVLRVRATRAEMVNGIEPGKPVPPDGKPRAYILDSLRHPAEVNLLRAIYGDAFVLIGVVCEERKRIDRMSCKYRDAGHDTVKEFMKRDEAAAEPYGQQVAKAFHLSDFFVDNTVDRTLGDGVTGNPDWLVTEHLSRLITILTHSKLVRPEIAGKRP